MTTNIWIRPGADVPWGAASYGTGDGSSYANAFAGVQNEAIDWSIRDLQVWVCGVHAPIADTSNISARFLRPNTGGTAQQPTIIRGDDPNEAGAIWGGHFFDLTEWSVHDAPTFTYQLTLPGTGAQFSTVNGWIMDMSNNGVDSARLVKRASIADVQANPGSYYATGTDSGSTVYVRLYDDGDPTAAHRVLFPNRGHQLIFDDIKHTIFYKMGIYGTICRLEQDGIQFRRCRMWYSHRNETFPKIMIDNDSDKIDDVAVYRCELGRGSYGAVYTTWVRPVNGVVQAQPERWFVTRNHIEEVGDTAWNEGTHPDDHGIGIQNIDTAYAYGNIVANTGPGIVAYVGGGSNPDEYMRNVRVRRNVVRDLRTDPVFFAPRGIEFDSQDGVCDCTGNVISHNVCRGWAAGGGDPVSAPGCGFKFADTNPLNVPTFKHNVAEDVPDGIYSNSADQYLTVQHFTSLAPTERHVRLRQATTNASFDNNTYSGGPGGDEFRNGITDYTWSEWQGLGQDANSTHSA